MNWKQTEKVRTQLSTVVKTLSPYTVTFNEILNLAKYLSVSLRGEVTVLLLTYRIQALKWNSLTVRCL